MDVRLSSDNVLIAIHDADFIATSNDPALVKDTASTALPALQDVVRGYTLQPSD